MEHRISWMNRRNGSEKENRTELREGKYSQATVIECTEADKGSRDSAARQDRGKGSDERRVLKPTVLGCWRRRSPPAMMDSKHVCL